jgi:NADH-quinone oxidoreductase subunit A
VSFSFGHSIALYSMLFFLFVLTVGFYFEWKKGALDWY